MSDELQSDSRRKLLVATGSLTALGLAGCLGDEEEADPEPDASDDDHYDDGHEDDHGHDDDYDHDDVHDEIGVAEFELLDRDHDDDVLAYVHGDHWDHGPLEVPIDGTRVVGVYVETDHGEVGDDGYELHAEANDGVSVDSHGDHVDVHGEEQGFTELTFQLVEDGDVVYETPELEVAVDDHDDDDGHGHGHGDVEELKILDRAEDPHEQVAEYHDDHWDSDLPHVHVDDYVSLGAEFYDDHDDEIPIGGGEEYELGVRIADDADTDIVEIDEDDDFHGDHVHIHGVEEGETEVVFLLWHDDHADWESDPIAIEVEDH